MTTIHTRQLQQYSKTTNNTHKTTNNNTHKTTNNNTHKTTNNNTHKTTNNNTHKTTTTIHTRQLQKYKQDNYNNTHNTTNNNTHKISVNTTFTNGKQHHGKKVLYTVSSIFPHTYFTHTLTPALQFSPLYCSYKHFP